MSAMTENDRIVLAMVSAALNGTEFDATLLCGKTPQQWSDIFRIVSQQGVLALCYDIVNNLPPQSRPPKPLHIRFALSAERIEKRYFSQLAAARILSDELHAHGIRFFILKGLAISRYYPVPSKRECGDIDCFLEDGYERGNRIAESMGAKVDRDYYKHSHISYRGTLIENHRFCTAVRGSSKSKELEKRLQTMIADCRSERIEYTNILIPPADFNTVFLTRHALFHFRSEGITLRHIADWHRLLTARQNDINWPQVNSILEQNDMKTFADAVTAICVKHLGLRIANPEITTRSAFADKILDDIFSEQTRLFASGFGKWKGRAMMISNILRNRWRYSQIYGHSITGELFKYAFGFIFDRNPRLD